MEKNEISIHEVRIFRAFKDAGATWLTAREVAGAAAVAERTARAHCLKFVRLGLLDQAEVFPAHRYRLATKAARRNGGYHQRLCEAEAVFGFGAEAGGLPK